MRNTVDYILPANTLFFSDMKSVIPVETEQQTQWFDAIDTMELDDTWFDASEDIFYTCPSTEEPIIETQIPLTEDCLRGLKQLIKVLAEYKNNELISRGLSTLFPTIPFNIIMAADMLYSAITEKKNLDLVLLSTFGLSALYYQDNDNVISKLALLIKETLVGAIGENYLEQFISYTEEHHFSYLNTALAVLAMTTHLWLTDAKRPQRRYFQIPAFMGKLFIRASLYWQVLGGMTQHHRPSVTRVEQNSAFTVDTCITTRRETDWQPSVKTQKIIQTPKGFAFKEELLTFVSNSTVNPELLTRATVENKPSSSDAGTLDITNRLHNYAVDKLKQASKIADVMYCRTNKIATTQPDGQHVITYTTQHTQCDALPYPSTRLKKNVAGNRIIPALHGMSSTDKTAHSAAHSPERDITIPLMIASASGSALSFHQPGRNKKIILSAAIMLTLTAISSMGKFVWCAQPTEYTKLPLLDIYSKRRNDKKDIIQKLSIPTLNLFLKKYLNPGIPIHNTNQTTTLTNQEARKFSNIRSIFYSKKNPGAHRALLRAIFDRAYHADEFVKGTNLRQKRTILLLKCLQITELTLQQVARNTAQSEYATLYDIHRELVARIQNLKNRKLVLAFQHFMLGSFTKEASLYGVANYAQLLRIIEDHLLVTVDNLNRNNLALFMTTLLSKNTSDEQLIDIALNIFGKHPGEMNKEISVAIIHDYIFGSLLKEKLREFLDTHKGITLSSTLLRYFTTELQKELSASTLNKEYHSTVINYVSETLIPFYFPVLDNKIFPTDYELTSSVWGLMHAGMIFASRIGIDHKAMNQNDIYKLGILCFQLLSNRQIPSSWVDAFSLPAHLFHEINSSVSDVDEKQQLHDYLQFLDQQININMINENKLADFLQQLEQFKKLSDFDKHFYELHEKKFIRKGIDLLETTSAMAHEAYETQNQQLKTSFIEIDKQFLYAAMDELADDDIKYLNTAEIMQGEIIMHAEYFPGIGKDALPGILPQPQYMKLEMETGFATFIARKNDEKRIYSFWKTPNGYVIRRTEQDITIYKQHIFDKVGLYAFFKLSEVRELQVIKKTSDSLYELADKILAPHAEYFYTQITKSGNDKTEAEKARRILIPFYDFAENVNEKNIIGATISLLLELYSIATPFLKSASFLLRYSSIMGKNALASGAMIAMTLGKSNINIVLKKATQEFIRKGVVPATRLVSKKEIVRLGIDMMQSFVPGFDFVHRLSSYTAKKIFKSISSAEGIFSTSLKRSTTFSHRYFSLSMQGNYRYGLKDLVSCTLNPRSKRSPNTLNFLCLPTAKNSIITRLKKEVSRVTTEWNIHPRVKDPKLLAEEVKILELLASKQNEELHAISAYTSAGSEAINRQLRTTSANLLAPPVRNRANKILAQYQQLEEYNGFSYRIMNAKNSAIDNYKVGDVLTDRGFVSSSALLTNTKNWYASAWVKARKKPTDGNLLIIYDHSVEKKIASNSLLADHILIKPDTKLKIVDTGTIVSVEGDVINVIAVKHYQKMKPARNIYNGETIRP